MTKSNCDQKVLIRQMLTLNLTISCALLVGIFMVEIEVLLITVQHRSPQAYLVGNAIIIFCKVLNDVLFLVVLFFFVFC